MPSNPTVADHVTLLQPRTWKYDNCKRELIQWQVVTEMRTGGSSVMLFCTDKCLTQFCEEYHVTEDLSPVDPNDKFRKLEFESRRQPPKPRLPYSPF